MEFDFHLASSAFHAIVGTLINIIAIAAVIIAGLHKNKHFTFVLNLFVSNLLMSSISSPLSIASAILSCAQDDVLCPYSGFLIFSISGITLWSLSMISINRYVLIVHPSHYDSIFTIRNTRIILAVIWLYSPTLCALPLTRAWGNFVFNEDMCLCTPFVTDNWFRTYSLVSTAMMTVVPISLCYLAILNKVRTSNNRITGRTQIENTERIKQQKQLMRTILVMISVFILMNIPFIITVLLDPGHEKFSLWVHFLSLYLAGFSYTTNTLTYALMNRQIRNSLVKIFKRVP